MFSFFLPCVEACFDQLNMTNDSCRVLGPKNMPLFASWYEALKDDRKATQEAIGWKGGVSDQVPWTLTAYIQPQVHPYDRYLYDPEKKTYTVGRYLEDLKTRYGGIDAVLLWPVYTQIGVDDRNQFDMWRSMPGGLDGVANLTAQFHEHGVKMLWPQKPWDVGTHREPTSDAKTFAQLLKQTNGDGLNGDTMVFFDEEFYAESAKVGHPIALEPEGGGTDKALNWQTMGWGYWGDNWWNMSVPTTYPEAPVVDRFKFVTEGKFLTNVCNRWAKSRTDDLQNAWFNGDGYESWENVWGVWNGITPHDGEAIRRVATMLRHFGKEGFLTSPAWVPHTQELLGHHAGIYASKFPGVGSNSTLWTVVNRAGDNFPNIVSAIACPSMRYYDCYHGVELKIANHTDISGDVSTRVSFAIEPHGYGCLFETAEALSEDMQTLLDTMRSMTAKPLASYDNVWKYLLQKMLEIPATALASEAPTGTVFVPREETFNFTVSGVEIEGDTEHGVGTQYPWEEHPQRHHSTTMAVGPFYIDKFPVTIANYSAYLATTGYRPVDDYNWLKNWNGSTTAPASMSDLPVTYVSLAEARAYCSWKGARLPHSWEWQYAAQGTDSRLYPWGNDKDQSRFPVETNGTTFEGPESVTAHSPMGDSLFGVSDLIGNVWQYTDEFQDDHNRYVIVRGGSNYYPNGSTWYFPQAKELNTHNKYFLFDESYERAGTVGFRCIVDAPGTVLV